MARFSGDVQDLDHLNKIFKVCELTPGVQHWLPTREAWTQDHVARAPRNLVVRFSMPMIDQAPAGAWPNTSTVVTKAATCPAPQQGNACLDCRACWDPKVKNIAYGEHYKKNINFWEGPAHKHAPGHKLQALKEQATS